MATGMQWGQFLAQLLVSLTVMAFSMYMLMQGKQVSRSTHPVARRHTTHTRHSTAALCRTISPGVQTAQSGVPVLQQFFFWSTASYHMPCIQCVDK